MYDRLGDWRSAVGDWTISLEHASSAQNLYFLESRARAYELGKQWPAAERDWSTLVRLTHEYNGEFLLGRGECYLHMGRLEDARTDFKEALAQAASSDTICSSPSANALAIGAKCAARSASSVCAASASAQ